MQGLGVSFESKNYYAELMDVLFNQNRLLCAYQFSDVDLFKSIITTGYRLLETVGDNLLNSGVI